MSKTFSEVLTEVLEEKGWDRLRFCSETQTPEQTVIKWLSGESLPSYKAIGRIVDKTDIDPKRILVNG